MTSLQSTRYRHVKELKVLTKLVRFCDYHLVLGEVCLHTGLSCTVDCYEAVVCSNTGSLKGNR